MGLHIARILLVLTAFGSSLVPALSTAQASPTNFESRHQAISDVEATAELLLETHPGLLAISGDRALRQRWEGGLRIARQRAQLVDTEGGRRAVLDGLANVFQDPHVAFQHTGARPVYNWPGFTVNLGADGFKVAFAIPETGILAGDRLLSCDGRSAMALVRTRLIGFRAYLTDRASVVSAVPFLFVDDGNPFVGERPRRCLFQSGSDRKNISLNWSVAEFGTMLPGLVSAAMYQGQPLAQASIRDGTIWISLPDLGPDAQAVVDASSLLLPSAPSTTPVLVDLRTNTGGNSYYGDQLLAAIYGPEAITDANEVAGLQATEKVWRASPTALGVVRWRLSQLDVNNPASADQLEFWQTLEGQLETALELGVPFNQPIAWTATRPQQSRFRTVRPRGVRSADVFVLTDNFCSSSCLLLVSQLRAMGAVSLGSATTLSRRYTEAAQVPLPSSRSTLTTLVSMSTGGRHQIGPFVPERRLPGSVRTSQGVERWVLEEIRRTNSEGTH